MKAIPGRFTTLAVILSIIIGIVPNTARAGEKRIPVVTWDGKTLRRTVITVQENIAAEANGQEVVIAGAKGNPNAPMPRSVKLPKADIELGNGYHAETVIGSDGRYAVSTTKKTTGYLTMYWYASDGRTVRGRCGADLYSDDDEVKTLARCLFYKDTLPYRTYFTAGQNGADTGSTCRVSETVISGEYYDSRDPDYNYAKLRLYSSCNFADRFGHDGLLFSYGSLVGQDHRIYQYATDKRDSDGRWNKRQYVAFGTIIADYRTSTRNSIRYETDTGPGSLGAGVCEMRNELCYHIGTHQSAIRTNDPDFPYQNVAVGMDRDHFDFLRGS